MNPKITMKDANLLKGALRRVFARSDLHHQVITRNIIPHVDSTRKRVKTWVRCEQCERAEAKSNTAVDHKRPFVPLDSSFQEMVQTMTWDAIIDLVWCDIDNLQLLCDDCHNIKSKEETKLRAQYKKEKKRKYG